MNVITLADAKVVNSFNLFSLVLLKTNNLLTIYANITAKPHDNILEII